MQATAQVLEQDSVFYPAEQAFFARREKTSTFEWAQKNFRIVSGPLRGKFWSPSTIPYAQGIMDWFDKPFVRKIFICAPSQSGKTTIAYACLGSVLCRTSNRGPAGVGMPDEAAVERIFQDKLIPHFQTSPALRKQLSRSYPFRKTEIRLIDSAAVYGIWAGSESKMSSVSLQFLLVDEEDAYPDQEAVGIMEERTIAYEHTSKVVRFSKPRGVEEESTIWRDLQAEAQTIFEFRARCPACQTLQRMDLDNIRVPANERNPKRIINEKLAWYECVECGYHWNDHVRNKAVALGKWVMRQPLLRPTVIGFHIPSWISPFVSLSKVVADFFRSQDEGPRGWTRFKNNHEAQPGQTVVAETDESRLTELIVPELPPQVVPDRAAAVTLSADMQKDHFYYSICAHAVEPREEWIIDYGRVGSFQELSTLIFASAFQKEGSGSRLSVWRAALDTGGGEGYPGEETRTRQAYEWLLKQRPGVIFGTKGMSRKTLGVHVKFSKLQHFPDGRTMRMGLKLYQLDTDAFKDEIFWRISEESTEPIWFHAQADEGYFRQILSEKKVIKDGKEIWKRVRQHNHWLDCLVGHMAMAHWQWTPSLAQVAPQGQGKGQAKDKPPMKQNRQKPIKPKMQNRPSWFNNR